MKKDSQSSRTLAYKVVGLAVLLLAPPATACRFNVREAGFAELEHLAYRVTAWLPSGTDQELIEELEASAAGLFSESNLDFDSSTAEAASDAAEAFEARWGDVSPPVLLIASPEHRTMALPLPAPGPGFIDSARSILRRVVSSPARDAILEYCVPALAIVLFFEGEDPEENALCRAAIDGALERLARNQHALEKPAEDPGRLVLVSSDAADTERVLLWSLGMDFSSPRPAQAVILFGKARRMGTVLSGEYLQQDLLVRTMALAGASCECGLDRNWLQGPRIPLRWDRVQRERLAKSLGFDPESPLIKMEISQILNQSGLGPRVAVSSPMLGYSEAAVTISKPVEGEAEEADLQEGVPEIDHVLASLPVFPDAPGAPPEKPEMPARTRLLLLITMLALLNLVVGMGAILWRRWTAS